jgi:hypothetical protein
VICNDSITEQNEPGEFNVWQCESCHNCFHLPCVKQWAARSGGVSLAELASVQSWKCACCQRTSDFPPFQACWCRQSTWNTGEVRQYPNSCGIVCPRDGVCEHDNPIACTKKCHPGPCDGGRCACPLPPSPPKVPKVPKPPGSLGRMVARFKVAKREKVKGVEMPLLFFVLIYGTLTAFIAYRNQWRAKHYKCKSRQFLLSTLNV